LAAWANSAPGAAPKALATVSSAAEALPLSYKKDEHKVCQRIVRPKPLPQRFDGRLCTVNEDDTLRFNELVFGQVRVNDVKSQRFFQSNRHDVRFYRVERKKEEGKGGEKVGCYKV
jgi:hypothetical protein